MGRWNMLTADDTMFSHLNYGLVIQVIYFTKGTDLSCAQLFIRDFRSQKLVALAGPISLMGRWNMLIADDTMFSNLNCVWPAE